MARHFYRALMALMLVSVVAMPPPVAANNVDPSEDLVTVDQPELAIGFANNIVSPEFSSAADMGFAERIEVTNADAAIHSGASPPPVSEPATTSLVSGLDETASYERNHDGTGRLVGDHELGSRPGRADARCTGLSH